MPTSEKTKNFSLHVGLMERLEEELERYQIRHKEFNISLGSFINMLIKRELDREKFLEKFAPHYSVVGVQDDVLHVKDARKNRTFQIQRHKDRLRCIEDNSVNCDHVMYALAQGVDVVKLFTDIGDELAKNLTKANGRRSLQRMARIISFAVPALVVISAEITAVSFHGLGVICNSISCL
jgi:hypothetical protein